LIVGQKERSGNRSAGSHGGTADEKVPFPNWSIATGANSAEIKDSGDQRNKKWGEK
jgi:hypothetical protein